uniref:Major facilitator superfamily (MFS) profile domain-containing protein n=1 Tax=Phakopsora pachyrhizi TaxID=170000 RepID=A0A0S1MIY9_PHAPC
MKSVLPTQAIYISLFITAINLLMTFPPLFLIDRLGRRPLLLISSTMMALSSFILGHSINLGLAIPSSLAIVIFVAGFSLGLGPVPFVILSEVVPNHAISSVGSLGLAVNWASNFIVGLMFLPLRNWLNNIDGDGDVIILLLLVEGLKSFQLKKPQKKCV